MESEEEFVQKLKNRAFLKKVISTGDEYPFELIVDKSTTKRFHIDEGKYLYQGYLASTIHIPDEEEPMSSQSNIE